MDARPSPADPAQLEGLQRVLVEAIPLAAQMGATVDRLDEQGLAVSMPLEPNLNPHQTAFAGSLNALCTLAGWAMTQLLVEQIGEQGGTVIRRSSIKYHTPVQDERVVAICQPIPEGDLSHFSEMLKEKGQSKLDHVVRISGSDPDRPSVLFAGSYVVHRA